MFISSLLNENSKSCKRFDISLRIFSFLFFLMYLQFSAKKQSDTISIVQGTTIFSIDDSFNKHLTLKKIVFNHASISTKNISNEKKILITSKENLSKNKEKRKQLKILKRKKNLNTKHEEKQKIFYNSNIKNTPSSSHFSKSRKENQAYVNQNNNHDYSKLQIVQNLFIINKALNFLHSQKIFSNNNQSFNFYYSEFVWARPPPLKINF